MPRIALNGLGRIGKLALRNLIDCGAGGDIVLINDPAGDAEQHALLMEFDSVHGRWPTPVSHEDGALILSSQRIRLSHEKTIDALPLAELGVDLVIDCTGVFKTAAKLAPYYKA
ncbi:glyceraldehyde 3-phosphate dehydrogenase NAD-binding domain-containing protein, partial [Pseudotabrizicola sp.]|uniref:glyceraldehyde 3-phosphate dehydrogenase NAD-binding domain-containing protein n=1 Tax=Pseudotabrizicola sp. TaxID=2939647 RepID=UPI00272271B3